MVTPHAPPHVVLPAHNLASTMTHATFRTHGPHPRTRASGAFAAATGPENAPDDTSPCGATLLPIRVESHELLAFLDSGSAVSIIPASSLSKCNTPSTCTPTTYIVHGASGSCLDVIGEVSLTIHLSGMTTSHPFMVINGPAVPGDILLGYDFMARTGLHPIPRENIAVHNNRVYALTPSGRVWRRSHCHSLTSRVATPSAPASNKVTTGSLDMNATTATPSSSTRQPQVTPTPTSRVTTGSPYVSATNAAPSSSTCQPQVTPTPTSKSPPQSPAASRPTWTPVSDFPLSGQ
nr:mucin-5AC-like [Penaeus vannamei]